MFRELIVTVGLLAVLSSMLLPLPPALLDFLLVGNLILALLLLVSSLYISDSLKLSALPSMLLLATLYRLALNVATTRMILGSGEAGRVIQAFGGVVIGGNLIVGAVVFLVITLIQFIVIAKGSERVAEVAARFTLDALPGKQMSIDADVRSGLIDFETARQRRMEMQTESRFYGALDGAMKFVKGDAIAGLFITAVNIVGGLGLGLLAEGLALPEALAKYTLLTIGDGLLSQIPALLNALAAGMVVTRVVRGDGATLAGDVLSQLGQVKRAKIIIALIALALLWVPGMPKFPLLFLSLVFLVSLLIPGAQGAQPAQKPRCYFEPRSLPLFQLRFGLRAAPLLRNAGLLEEYGQNFRQEIYEQCGLILGIPEFCANPGPAEESEILWRGIAVHKENVGQDLKQHLQNMFGALKRLTLTRPVECVDDVLTRRTLDYLDKEAPEMVSAVVPAIISVTQLSELLKQLLAEGVSVRHFDMIVQAVAETGTNAANPRMLLEQVRVALGRGICQKHLAANGCLPAILFDPALDLMVANAERENLPFDGECIALLAGYFKSRPAGGEVLLASKTARRLIKECLDVQGLNVDVIAHEEVPKDIRLEVCGRIEAKDPALNDKLIERLAA